MIFCCQVHTNADVNVVRHVDGTRRVQLDHFCIEQLVLTQHFYPVANRVVLASHILYLLKNGAGGGKTLS